MSSLQDLDIFELKPLVTNLNCKLSTVSDYDPQKQLLCLVSEENEIILRYTAEGEQIVLKMISWFRRMSRVIHDVSFDPSGTWLLVLCFDNTLHIVPALAVVGGNTTQLTYQSFSTTKVTSYIIPFVGPHECPNSKACPNHEVERSLISTTPINSFVDDRNSKDTTEDDGKNVSSDSFINQYSHDIPANMQESSETSVPEDKTGNSHIMCSSFMCSSTCPYPLSVVWWQTIDLGHRAIIGYSDGSICFVGLSPNCPFVASTTIDTGSVVKLLICKDNNLETITLLITSSLKQQYKLLLEQTAIKYVYPGDISPTTTKTKDDWQIVMPVKTNSNSSDPASDTSQQEEDVFLEKDINAQPILSAVGTTLPYLSKHNSDVDDANNRNGILPAARARLASLKSLGSKKLNAIKMKLSDQRQKLEEYSSENSLSAFAIIDSPSLTPEALSVSAGTFYTIQNLRHTYLLSALYRHLNNLTVHSMDISLKPVFLYKIPPKCHEILISSNILYSIQDVEKEVTSTVEENNTITLEDMGLKSRKDPSEVRDENDKSHLINAVGVISSAMASVQNEERDSFNTSSLLGLFRFEHETVLNLYQMTTHINFQVSNEEKKDDKNQCLDRKQIRTPLEYVHFYSNVDGKDSYSLREMEIMKNEFPKICYDPCYVITNKNVYFIQLRKEPFAIFLDAALAGKWTQCHEFCNTFDLSYEVCIEFAGDYLLRKRKVAQALLTYNAARIKPIRTALKLAMFGQTYALMHLCAMALKSLYILKSQYFCHPIIKSILDDIVYRHSEDVQLILPAQPSKDVIVNEGASCSDYNYGLDEVLSNLQMSPSSQFHLANLLLITLAEKAVKDKNYIPLWNFLVTNTKFHTNMTSIVLCQSGLYSSALILAKARGACIDTFLALNSVVGQEFGWYSELNVCLYNLSEPIFMESITYLPHASLEYFTFLQDKLENIRECVLKRLATQLNPFSAVYRPMVSHTSSSRSNYQYKPEYNDNNSSYIFEFCKSLIETYLAVLIHMESMKTKQDDILNSLSSIRLTYEDNQFAIETAKFLPLAAGFAHCACILDGVAYFWGSNGVPCNYNVTKPSDPPEPPHAVKCLEVMQQLNLEVHTVACGRQHSLILTNNGLYAFGNNNVGQLGIGKHMLMSLQPTLVKALDGKNITALEVGQYHNAVIADGFLYTWGWGVYGQLGHGSAENISEPSLVPFFQYMKVITVSLGHAHSLVLCKNPYGRTELYVFGSNHFGQLGVSPINPKLSSSSSTDVCIKSLLPIKILVCTANIRLIHTKFFCNLVVDENNKLYTWGSSPQALRLANQIKRRAHAKQKIEEFQRKEISKRFEETILSNEDVISEKARESESSNDDDAEEQPNVSLQPKETKMSICANEKNENSSESTICSATLCKPSDIKVILNSNDGEAEEDRRTEEKNSTSDTEMDAVNGHMLPHMVDTSKVDGEIRQLSSGLFHFAMVTSTGLLYTWGKNLEHQLGTLDKDRRDVPIPTSIDAIGMSVMHVQCGADFTIVMSHDYVVKAFGGNTNGQCARDLGSLFEKGKQRVVCLPTSKRLMRYESQCIEIPVEVNLPRPRIRLDNEPVRYLKIIPEYQAHFIQELGIVLEPNGSLNKSPQTTNPGQESDEMISSIENLSLIDADSVLLSCQMYPNNSSNDITADDHSYSRLPPSDDDLSTECTQNTRETCNYIHYCLYVFHGLYNPDKIEKFSKNRLEYRIRTLMLNFKFVDAFSLCLIDCTSGTRSIKIFEYFTKDTSFVPMRRHDLKFFIYRLFQHFIAKKFDISECENFFLSDLDYYLLELSYVLYFNNNNTELERNLNEKFKNLITQDPNHNEEYRLEDTDTIFDNLSVKFKTIVCQTLLKFCND